MVNQSMKGEFPGGKTVVYGLKDGGVAITKKNLDAEEKAAVEKAEEAIKSGEVTVPSTMK